MTFQLNAGEEITIDGISYTVGEHPMAPGVPYGQEGRQGIVYQLIPQIETSSGWKALKVFRQQFRNPKMVYLSENKRAYANLPGLMVCERIVLTPQQHNDVLSKSRDLLYAVVMPWIKGPTWMDVIMDKQELSKRESLLLARSLAKVLSGMEQNGLAHCDLSGANILLPKLVKDHIEDGFSYVELVDVEQMYTPRLEKPDIMLGGSSGYAGQKISSHLWSSHADRFAGAVLIAEMLGWCDGTVLQHSWGESYFSTEELQQKNDRYNILMNSLRSHWGEEVARLFEQAWESEELYQCPTFGDWLIALMGLDQNSDMALIKESNDDKEATSLPQASVEKGLSPIAQSVMLEPVLEERDSTIYNDQIKEAEKLEKQGDLEGALSIYRDIQKTLPSQSNLAQDLKMLIVNLESVNKGTTKIHTHPKPKSVKKSVLVSVLSILVITVAVYLFFIESKNNEVVQNGDSLKNNVSNQLETKSVEQDKVNAGQDNGSNTNQIPTAKDNAKEDTKNSSNKPTSGNNVPTETKPPVTNPPVANPPATNPPVTNQDKEGGRQIGYNTGNLGSPYWVNGGKDLYFDGGSENKIEGSVKGTYVVFDFVNSSGKIVRTHSKSCASGNCTYFFNLSAGTPLGKGYFKIKIRVTGESASGNIYY